MKRGKEILVGVGDSSFYQIPCPWASSSRLTAAAENSSKSHDSSSSSNDDDFRVPTKISQIACGATTCLAAVNNDNSSAIDHAPPAYLLEWGTGLYGERLSTETSVPRQGDHPSFLNHPAPVALSSLPLGLPSSPPAIRYIACGAHFVVASLENGGCISWGGGREGRRALGRGSCGTCGQCRTGSTPAATTPPLSHPTSSKPDWVAEPLGLGGSKVADLAAGDDHVIAVGTNGSAWAWGRGDCGQLGYGSPPDGAGCDNGGSACVPMAVQLPSPASGAPLDDGGLGSTSSGAGAAAIGVGSDHGSQDPQKGPGALVIRAACGRDHSAVITNDGRVWTFGSGLHGQLGLGTVGETSSTPAVVDTLLGVGTMRPDGSFTGMEAVACGAWHTAALSTTGDVYTWGWARFGALGPSPFVASSPRRPQQDTTASATGDSATTNSSGASPPCGKRKLETTSSTAAAAAAAAEEGEVRPYPGLVDGMDDILADYDDQLVSVSCGARYTVATSRKSRAFVWGQVAPPLQHYGGRGGGRKQKGGDGRSVRGTGMGDGKGPPLGSFSTPREIKPAELRDAAPSKSLSEGGDGRRCCEVGSEKGVRVGADDEGDSRWKVSAVGCGPWFVVFGLQEEEERQG
ncbi:unnamed protein product, partial [Ectocarpus fasciculatus]